MAWSHFKEAAVNLVAFTICVSAYVAPPSNLYIAADPIHRLAAQDLRRYLYLATRGQDLPQLLCGHERAHYQPFAAGASAIVLTTSSKWRERVPQLLQGDSALSSEGVAALTAMVSELRPSSDDHGFKRVELDGEQQAVIVVGASNRAVLYAVYSLVERVTSIRFRLHGDVLPDRGSSSVLPTLQELTRNVLASDVVDAVLSPGQVEKRGLNPFHDFAEGPDWWNAAEYKLVFDQMAKMKMNFIGLHTYGGDLAEPTVWMGLEGDFDPKDGHIQPSGMYGATYATTTSGAVWGGFPMNVSDYLFGSHIVFAGECFSSDAVHSAGLCPGPTVGFNISRSGTGNVWDRVSAMLSDSFAWAHRLGHETCVGTQVGEAVPLHYPGNRSEALKEYYKGAFEHIQATYNASYFWIWTVESWKARQDASVDVTDRDVQACVEDFLAAHAARDELYGGTTSESLKLATCGWTLGPMADRTYFDKVLPKDFILSSINEKVGNSNVESAYKNITRHKSWSIPWLEDDGGMVQLQLWANRTLVYAADAAQLGVSGLLGIHWHTRDIAPQLSALAEWPWHRRLTSTQLYEEIAAVEFGLSGAAYSEARKAVAAVFERVDSYPGMPPPPSTKLDPRRNPSAAASLPRPTVFGPGALDRTFVFNAHDFEFVEEFAQLRSLVAPRGPLNLERFDYWLASFQYSYALGYTADVWRRFNFAVGPALDAISANKESAFQDVWHKLLLPLRLLLVNSSRNMMNWLAATVHDTGALGTIANMQQLSLKAMFSDVDLKLKALYGSRCMPLEETAACYIDNGGSGRVLPFSTGNGECTDSVDPVICAAGTQLDHRWCSMQCQTAGFTLAGVEGSNGDQCYCGHNISTTAVKAPTSECATPCPRNASENCGGGWRVLTFQFQCSSPSPVMPPPLPPAAVPSRTYTGPERLFVLTPRGRVEASEGRLEVRVLVFTAKAFVVQPKLMVRQIGTSAWKVIAMIRVAAQRQVWTAVLDPLPLDDFEYYALARTETASLLWPAGGAPNAHTVVISPPIGLPATGTTEIFV